MGRGGRLARGILRERAAQATFEMAISAPVLIVLALIVYNLMLFACATARFDRVAPDIVLAHAVSPATGSPGDVPAEASETVKSRLEQAMEGYAVEIEVTCDEGPGGTASVLSLVGEMKTYRCVMRMRPWPSGLTVAGVRMGAPAFLEHSRPVKIDPWRPGVVI